MDPQTLLQQLQPLRQPAPIEWWPPAPGWWMLAALMLSALVLGVWWWLRHRRQNRYRRAALRELDRLITSNTLQLASLNRLLKATALQACPNDQVASLTGDAWLEFLCDSAPVVDRTAFAVLAEVYRTPDASVSETLNAAARLWIRRHHIDPERRLELSNV